MDDYGGSASIWPQIVLIVILTMINAFFAATEMAVVSINKKKIEQMSEDGDKSAAALIRVMQDQTGFLSTIQVGITFAGFLSSASASANLSGHFGEKLTMLGIPSGATVAMVLITILISYISLVFGELVPKRIALQNSEKVALNSVKVISFFSKLTKPFVKLLSFSTTLTLKLVGQYSEDIEEQISEEELRSYITVGQEQGVINAKGKDMMINIFDFDDRMAYEIMTPRTSIYMVEHDNFNIDTIEEILKEGFSRVPIYGEDQDDIVGIVNVKDLFQELSKNNYESIDLDKVMKEPYFVPESKKIDQLLKDLQNTKNYVALLVDEYGGFSGMVTVEDIVEEIVGEIEDEYDLKSGTIKQLSLNSYIIDGNIELKAINEKLFTELESENHETISGLTLELLGYFPDNINNKNITLRYKNCLIKILGMKENRIDKVLLTIEKEENKN